MMYLEIRHDPELVDLFPVELVEELVGCVFDILARGDAAADHEDIGAGLQGVFDNFDTDAAGGCAEEFSSRPPS